MNAEIKALIQAVKDNKSKSVQTVVDEFFGNIVWSQLKAEYELMNTVEKQLLIAKLTKERNSK